MFELESAVNAWRRQIEAHGRTDGATVAELEDHLREEFVRLAEAGTTSEAAWALAVERLGDPAMLCREFAKVRRLPLIDRLVLGVLLVIAGTAVAGAIMLFMRMMEQNGSPTLAIHMSAIWLGYAGGLVVALIAAYRTLRRVGRRAAGPALTSVSMRIIRLGGALVAACTALGVIFGAVWLDKHFDKAFSGSPRELGGLLVAATFLAVVIISRRIAGSPRATFALTVMGGGIVLAAWFGPIVLESGYVVPSMIGAGGLIGSIAVAVVALSLRDDAPDAAAA